jgi:Holliday junction resolvase
MELMQNTSKKLKQEPEKIEQVINSIKSFKGTFNNLRSVVMELVVIRLLSNDGLQDPIQYNRDLHIKEEHHSKEIDVMAGNKDELLFVECKAKLPTNSITKEEIDKWEKKIAHTNSWLKENSEDSILTRYKREIKHVFCTNVELDDRAEDKISELDAKHQKRPIDLWSDGMLSEKLKDQGLLELKKDYEEHFEKSVN